MELVIAFIAGLVVGAVIGALVYRNNALKAERELARIKAEIIAAKKKVGG